MSGKREREERFQIDEKTLEYKQTSLKVNDCDQKKDSMQQQRKILKIKTQEGPTNSLNIFKSPLFMRTNENKIQQKKAQCQEEINNQRQLSQNTSKKIQKKEEQQKHEEKQEVRATQQQNLNIFSNNPFQNGIGLFSKNNKSINLFQAPSLNLNFGFETGKQPENSQSLFSKKFQFKSQSIFGQVPRLTVNPQPQKQKQKQKSYVDLSEDDQRQCQEGDYQKIENDPFQNVDHSKSTGKYQYNSQCDVLFQQKALKIKKSNTEIIQNIQLAVQQDPKTKTSWILIRLFSTKVGILTGLLVKSKSEIKNFGGKDQNVVLSILVVQKSKKTCREIIKIRFEKPQQGKKFMQIVQNLIK